MTRPIKLPYTESEMRKHNDMNDKIEKLVQYYAGHDWICFEVVGYEPEPAITVGFCDWAPVKFRPEPDPKQKGMGQLDLTQEELIAIKNLLNFASQYMGLEDEPLLNIVCHKISNAIQK